MIESKLESNVLAITLCRSEKANALTEEMLTGIAAAIGENPSASLLILTGQGRVFSAGADLDHVAQGLATSPAWEAASSAIAGFAGLSIARLNGTVAGGAFGMVLACDLRVSVPQANFFYPVMEKGYLPQPSDPGRLAALIGPARAMEILMSGAKISANQALDWGLVNRISATDALDDAVRELAQAAHSATPAHIHAIKRMIP